MCFGGRTLSVLQQFSCALQPADELCWASHSIFMRITSNTDIYCSLLVVCSNLRHTRRSNVTLAKLGAVGSMGRRDWRRKRHPTGFRATTGSSHMQIWRVICWAATNLDARLIVVVCLVWGKFGWFEGFPCLREKVVPNLKR